MKKIDENLYKAFHAAVVEAAKSVNINELSLFGQWNKQSVRRAKTERRE